MSTIVFKCPKCNKGTIEREVDYGSDHGNLQGECDRCGAEFGFFYEIVIDDVHEIDNMNEKINE